MKTTESNKLIAEFMGYNWILPDKIWARNDIESYKYMIGDLKYHESWDWLMPVVEKIEDKTQRMFDCRKHKQYCSVRISIQKNIVADKSFMGFSINKKDAYYEAVIEFIKWYNENKTK